MRRPFTSPDCGRRSCRALPLFSLAAAISIVAGCEKTPFVAPTSSTITIYVSSQAVPLGGSTIVTATVIDSTGTPVPNGTSVTFTANLGTLSPAETATVNGKATTTLIAGNNSGTATVGAISGGTTAKTVDVTIGAAAVDRIAVTTDPPFVPASGGVVTLTATVFDAAGNLLGGVPVTFLADSGTLDVATQITNSLGRAAVRLSTSRDTTIMVSAGGKQVTATITASAAPTVTISASTGTSTALLTGQIIGFTVTVAAGAISFPIQNVTVDYGDGSASTLGAVTGQIAVSHIYTRAGAFTVTATARDTAGQQTFASTIIIVSSR